MKSAEESVREATRGFQMELEFQSEHKMPDQNILLMIDHIAHEVLMWIGFGTVVGLAAKGLMQEDAQRDGAAFETRLRGLARLTALALTPPTPTRPA